MTCTLALPALSSACPLFQVEAASPLPPKLGPGSGGHSCIGLSPSGQLFYGSTCLASEVTSFTVRGHGAGGAALLYITRKSLLYTCYQWQLRDSGSGFTHTDRLQPTRAGGRSVWAGGWGRVVGGVGGGASCLYLCKYVCLTPAGGAGGWVGV